MATKPKALTASQKKERNELAKQIVLQITKTTVIYQVLDQTDGAYTGQVNRVAFEMADQYMARAA